MSREIRKPLNAVLGLAQLLEKKSLDVGQIGITTMEATNGQGTLDMLRQENATIELVLMDIQMPIMDGVKATREMSQDIRLN